MSTLYLTQPDAILSKQQEAFKIALKSEDGTWKKQSIPAQTLEDIVLLGYPSMTGEAFGYALELGLPVHYLSRFGKYVGSALPNESRNGQLRLAQFRAHENPNQRLDIVKAIAKGKIHNQYNLLYRRGQKENPLKGREKLVLQKQSLDEVRGVEGLAAREYFACWQDILGDQWKFTGRFRRPPTDPVNALLSFGYGLLRTQVTAAAHIAGLDPYIGFLHETTRGQPALVLDLMEEFRPLIADSVVLTVLKQKEIKPKDFNESLGAYRLKDDACKVFLSAFDRKLCSEFKHPIFNYKCSYRRAIELQARLLARHLQEGIPYEPLIIR
ncbi:MULTISPECIES: type I-D CRISPR-associated endonuclease Cas1d [Cyanophyceae]|uniref:type I-D CRISPR-associated endonuclease Cas1d n=1 Tax=Cyanophyceae TaxID=3028117 RepID=UPI00016DCE10|nr:MULTISPECIES: type I-D CRISPR-associated endonuclease Cas1d [Cyanophyceae]ACB00881.1 CRISPR-associated protein Cas1 [Picosynechococcus sp. PCC 7002]SMH59006.1 CRISP-associated protein Cas1 [Picosynechococcus sp. OG1]SMQ86528.1 CRISP-associated protein Cas1 [Synechococcus sp. 7002]